MKKILLLLTCFIFNLNAFSQVKMNVWDKSPNVAKTMGNLKPTNLPVSFESKMPDGSTEIYDKLNVNPIKIYTSGGKKYDFKPNVYKSRDGFSILSYGENGWGGYHESKNGQFHSMSSTIITDDTIAKAKMDDFCKSLIPVEKKIGKTPPQPQISQLVRTDYYDPNIPINKICNVYLEISNDLHVLLGNNIVTTQNWVSNLFLGVVAIYAKEGISINLKEVYIWQTPDPFGYTTLSTSFDALSKFGENISKGLPIQPTSEYKHLLTSKGYGGIAWVNGNSDGYTPSTAVYGGYYRTAVSGMNFTSLPSNPSNITSAYHWPLYVFTHEMGHNLGSSHTQACLWKNDLNQAIGRIDSCYRGESTNTGPNCLSTNYTVSKLSTIPTIMSYCHLIGGTRMVLNGFGRYPRFAIRSALDYDYTIPTTTINLPSVTTTPISFITSNSVQSGGSVAAGTGIVKSRGVCWSTSQNPTIANSSTTDGALSGSYTSRINGLASNTTYYVRAWATNERGTSYGSQVSFTTTGATIPVVSTTTITSITNTTATSGGSITSDGGGSITAKGVCWSTSPSPTVSNSKTSNGTGTALWSSNITGLIGNSTYYVRAYATNSSGTGYGEELTLTTYSSASAQITTTVPTDVTCYKGNTGGIILSDGGLSITSKGVCWSTSPSPTITNTKTSNGTGNGPFVSNLVSLLPNTTYYLRSYLTTSGGTTYGNQVTFSTPPLPVITTGSPTNIGNINFTIPYTISQVSPSNKIINSGVVIQQNTSPPTLPSNYLSYIFTTQNSVGTYQALFSKSQFIMPGSLFYARSYLYDSNNDVYYGNTVSVTTLGAAAPVCTTFTPIVTTQNSTTSTAILGGQITTLGNIITERGFCYGTSPNPTTSGTKFILVACQNNCGDPMIYTHNLFSPNTTYYVRAYAINANGTAYGNQVTFTPPSFTTLPTCSTTVFTNLTSNSVTLSGNVSSNGGSSCNLTSDCRGFVYSSTTTNPTFEHSSVSATPNSQTITGSYTANVTGLTPGVTYFYRAYARNSTGFSYSSNGISFTTPLISGVPELTTLPVTGITDVGASTGGNIMISNGSSVTTRGICYSTSPNPDISNTIVSSGSGLGYFNVNLTGITPNTTYYARSYATNSSGTSYGNQVTFSTLTSTGSASIPTLSSTAISNITFTTATSGGNITSDGGAPITTRGVCWNTTGSPTPSNFKTVDGTGTGSFTSQLTGLSANTTYYLRAYASNSQGTAYGTQISFTTTAPTPPTISTDQITSVTSNSANLVMSISALNGSTISQRGFCYATTQTPTTSNFAISVSCLPCSLGQYTQTAISLSPNTTYYVRSYVVSENGTTYGNQLSFTTIGSLPSLSTTTVSSITQTSATSGGSITSDGGLSIISKGIVWSTSPTPTTDLATKTLNGSGSTSFTSNLTGLNPNTLYYVRSYAENSFGIGYGNEITFTTPPILTPNVSTTSITTSTNTTAVMGGNVTATGGATVTRRGICYSISTVPDTTNSVVNIGSGIGTFSQTVSGLSQGTTYYVRAFAINSAGISYGAQVSFTTTGIPLLSTTAASNITSNSFTTGGNITSAGGGTLTVTNRGICYSTTPNPSILNSTISSGAGVGAFTTNVTGLSQGVTYYVKAFATNSNGTGYGSEISVITSNIPSVTTTSITSLTTVSAITGGNVTSNGGGSLVITDRGVCYSTSPNPTILNTKVQASTFGTGTFTINLSNLTPGTTYYLKAYGVNSIGTGYGSEITFTTPSVPVLTTSAISGLSPTSVTSGGNISTSVGSSVIERGVCYSTSPNPTILNSRTSDGTETGTYVSNVTGLSPSTTYYLKAFAINSTGAGYGNEITFTTTSSGTVPSLTTTAVTSITQTTSSSGGVVTSDGGSSVTDKGICYGTSINPSTSDTKLSAGPGIGAFTSLLTNLVPNTRYYIRAYAINTNGTNYGTQVSFTTLPTNSIPSISTNLITSITSTTATSGGDVISDGNLTVTTRGICYSTTQNPTISNSTITDLNGGTGPFIVALTGLTPGTTYYVRAFATNSLGTGYGTELPFTTLSFPSVNTVSATAIGPNIATTGGNVISDGGSSITSRGVCYGTSQNPDLSNFVTSNGIGTGSFSSNLVGLVAATTYYVRAYATNSVGTTYGNQISFVTSGGGSSPTVTTTSVTSITSNSAVSGGNVTNAGSQNVTSRGVVWSTSPSPTISLSTKTVNGSGTGIFTSTISSLLPSTVYYVRAYATNSFGTGYGDDVQFTTNVPSSNSCVVTTYPAYKSGGFWRFKWNINSNCSSYTVTVSRYNYTNPSVPPPSNAIPMATGVRLTNYIPTSSEIISGLIDKQMSPQPAMKGYWYSYEVKCNAASCSGTNVTKSDFFYTQ